MSGSGRIARAAADERSLDSPASAPGSRADALASQPVAPRASDPVTGHALGAGTNRPAPLGPVQPAAIARALRTPI
jgi:hypothetical protein